MNKEVCRRYGITEAQLTEMYRDGLINEQELRWQCVVSYYIEVLKEELSVRPTGAKIRARKKTANHFGYKNTIHIGRIIKARTELR